jgi:acetylornithine deacetylase/succinyl-diaminopimelate desuccinylase-like protein
MHAVGEHVPVANLLMAAQVYLDAALTLCSQPAAKHEIGTTV